ncbi:MAG: hypothetical protein KJN60_07210, partial [Boseongicola sp.]|nr:hypothetical protein [Boseongicola sp.]
IKVRFKSQPEESASVISPEFENRATRRRQVTTRPIKPQSAAAEEIASANREAEEATPHVTQKKKSGREGGPIFLRRRWLASDGGA